MPGCISIYVPLHIRLTFFYALALGLALWFFGSSVYTQAETRAAQDLDNALKSRAASVRLEKAITADSDARLASNPITLPSVDALGTGGVSIEVLDSQLRLLASTTTPATNDSSSYMQPGVQDLGTSPIPWDRQSALELLRDYTKIPASDTTTSLSKEPLPERFNTILYQGQRIRVYTLLNDTFGSIHIIQTARSEVDIEQNLADLHNVLLGGGILVLALALGGGWLISWGVLSAVRRMTRTAQSIRASRDFSKRVPDTSFLMRDELATLAATFNQMLISLEEAYQRQQRFVADASHELRAPITSIRCNLDLLARAPDLPREEAQAALADTRAEAERMGRLVNDLLLLARADVVQQTAASTDRTKRERQEVDLDSLLLDIFRQYRPPGENAPNGKDSSGPHLTLQQIAPITVLGDADQLKQALVALVDNALKYTPQEGYVSLSLDVVDDYALVKVSDSGIGILPEDLPHIFERFYRANRARTRDRGGSGLGLAIAQSIAQEHGGSIEVESIPGKGSTFTLQLPVVA